MPDKPVVFVSCGQYSEAEQTLGRGICALIRELRPDVEPYFAQDQSTSEGLSNHILKALFGSAGFICVMHQRGKLNTPEGNTITRGSVWVEQEIAITTFMNQVLGRSIPTFYYRQAGVGLEGIRSVLLLNPRFNTAQNAYDRRAERAVRASAHNFVNRPISRGPNTSLGNRDFGSSNEANVSSGIEFTFRIIL